MSSDERENQPRVKRMRKGTKSCAECRRRKIKCIYQDNRDICRDCFERGSECVDQEHAQLTEPKSITDSSQSLRGRVSQLEDLVKQLVGKLDESRSPDVSRDDRRGSSPASTASYRLDRPAIKRRWQVGAKGGKIVTAAAETSLPRHQQEQRDPDAKTDLGSAPFVGLFDNAVVQPQGGWDEAVLKCATGQDMQDSISDTDKEINQRQSLLALIPPKTTRRRIARDYGAWWQDLFYVMSEMYSRYKPRLEDFLETNFEQGSTLALAQVLLTLAMCLQKMPADIDYSHLKLPLPPQRLSEHYITQVHKHVLSDDEVIGTFDGIGCLSIYSKFLFDIGKPRKAWLAHRRATTFAQLLNLHCKKSRAVDSPDCSSSRKDFVWFDLYFIDQVMALQLGQPYTISRQQFDLNDEEIRALPLDISLMLREAGMCARIVDRNWELPLKPLNTCLSRTSEIDADLDELEKVIPTEWLSEPDHREINVATTHVMFHFIHHQVRMYVHLPLMLRSATEKRFNHNRLAALQASRDMLKSYAVLRETCSMGSYICKAVDFQSFVATMILVLNLMGYASSASRRHPKPHSEDSEEDTADWQLVDSTTELIRSTTHEIGGKVSEQCIRCIELFASCHKYPGSVEEMKGETAKVVVPFFGTLVLAPGKRFDSQDMTKVASSLPTPPTNNSASASDYSGQSPLPFSSNEPFIGFDSYNNPLSNDFFGNGMVNLMDPPMDPMQRGSGSNVPAAMGSWPDTSMLSMDLDHDWSWYMSGGMNPTNMPK